MKLRLAVITAVLGFALRAAAPVAADGLVRDGVGPISTARGGTNQGFADNSAIILDNPAAMVNVDGCGLGELGVDTVITSVQYSNPFNDVDSKIRPMPAPVLGFVRKSFDERWAWGFGAFAPAGFGASYGTMVNPVVGPQVYKSIGGLGKLLPAISFRATERLSLGLSVGIGFSHIQLDGPFFLQTGPLAGAPTVLDLQGTGVAPVGSVGLQYRLFENLTIGATYTEQSAFDLRGPTNATLFVPGIGAVESRFDGKYNLTWPRSVAFGLKWDLCAHRRIGADVIWYGWEQAFDDLDVQLSNPTNPLIAPIVQGAGGSLPLKDVFPIRWRDTVSMRLGYETDWSELTTLRCGYVYHSSPAPDATLNPYLDGILEHAFSLGFSRKLSRATFNAAYQYNFSPTRHVTNSAIIGGDFDNSTMFAQAHFAMLSFLFPF
jgi:long-subunit fatty acid transport protein